MTRRTISFRLSDVCVMCVPRKYKDQAISLRFQFSRNQSLYLPKKLNCVETENLDWKITSNLEVTFTGSLRDHDLVISVLSSDPNQKGRINEIGKTKLTIFNILTGPKSFERIRCPSTAQYDEFEYSHFEEDLVPRVSFSLRAKEKRRIGFEISQIQINFSEDFLIQNAKSKLFLRFESTKNEVPLSSTKTDWKRPTNRTLSWEQMILLLQSTRKISLKKFLNNSIRIQFCRKKFLGSEDLAVTLIDLKTHYKTRNELFEQKVIQVTLEHPNNKKKIGSLDFNLSFVSLPEFAQMTEGRYTDYNVVEGTPLLPGFEEPEIYQVLAGSYSYGPKTYITIDFGTSTTGYAYSTSDVTDIDKVNIHMSWGEGNYRYKNITCLLYEGNRPIKWGYLAQSKFILEVKKEKKKRLKNPDFVSPFILIDNFKTKIHLNKIERNGRVFEIVRVIGDFLGLVRKDIIEELTKQGYETTRKYVKYVITVPSFWSDFEKRVMKEACRRAEIVSEEFDEEELFDMVSESEAAAIPCLLYDDPTACLPRTRFFSLEVGGGVIDISVYEVVKPPDGTKFGLRQVSVSSGEYGGGGDVLEEFLLFFRSIVPQEVFGRVVNSHDFCEFVTRWNEIWWRLGDRNFQEMKDEDNVYLLLPADINKLVSESILNKNLYNEEEGGLVLTTKMCRSFLSGTIARILDLVQMELEKQAKPIGNIFLSGAFCESYYFRNEMRNRFGRPGMKIVATSQPGIRVLQGATWIGKYPNIIESRCSPCTYIFNIRKEKEEEDTKKKKKKKKNGLFFLDDLGEPIEKKYKIMARAGDIIGRYGRRRKKKEKVSLRFLGETNGVLDLYVSNRPRIRKIAPPECQRLLSMKLKSPDDMFIFFPPKTKNQKKNDRLNVVVDFWRTERLSFEFFDPIGGKKLKNQHIEIEYNDDFEIKERRSHGRKVWFIDPDFSERCEYIVNELMSMLESQEFLVELKVDGARVCSLFKSFLL